MIAQLAEMAYRKAGQMFFCVQKDARSVTFSYRRARFAAAALAQQLAKRGYGRGTTLACNLYNGAEIVILSLAAAYGGFTLALLNPRLSYEERKLRIVERISHTAHDAVVDSEHFVGKRFLGRIKKGHELAADTVSYGNAKGIEISRFRSFIDLPRSLYAQIGG